MVGGSGSSRSFPDFLASPSFRYPKAHLEPGGTYKRHGHAGHLEVPKSSARDEALPTI